MNYLKERVAFLKGMAEGMNLSDATNEGKLLKAIIEVLDDVALAVDDIEEVQEELSDQVDNLDEDLAEVEKVIFDEDFDVDDEDDYIGEFECPHCKKQIEIFADMIDSDSKSIKCPECDKDIEIEWDCDCGSGCDCGCEDEE